MLITTKTLPIVAGFIKKISKDYPILNSQLSYPAYKRENIFRKLLGFKTYHVEQSNIHSFEVKEAEIHSESWHLEPYLNVNNQGKDYDYESDYAFMDDDPMYWRATVIKIGQHVTFKNNELFIKQQHPTNKNMIAIERIWFTKE